MIAIDINWEYFLGILGTLIALAYYANGRFTRLETSVEWLKDAINALSQFNKPPAPPTKNIRPAGVRSKIRTR